MIHLNISIRRIPNLEKIRFSGIFFTDGELWHEQRRFALRQLRDYGFGRRFDELEVEANEELLQFVDFLRNGPKFDFEKVSSCS